MKVKIIIFFIVTLFLFAPLISSAYIIHPANLTVIVNTQGSDSSFHFDLKRYIGIVLCQAPEKNSFALKPKTYGYIFGGKTDNSGTTENKNLFASGYPDYDGYWQDYEQFDIQTQNLSGSRTMSIDVLEGEYNYYMITQENNPGFKINNIHCASDNTNNVFLYQPDGVIFTPEENKNIICIFNNVKERNPVLIVPGLLGTEMKKGNELLWLDLGRMLGDIGDEFMDGLQFNSSLYPIYNNVTTGKVIENPDQLFNYTEGLKNEFKNQGYAENEVLFTFPYDWRYGVSGKFADGTTVTDLLSQKINDILQQTGASEVDVVAHSLGGLLVKKYAMDNPTDNHIGKAVFVGVPNTGAPKAVKVLLQGDNFGVPWLADSEIKKISENMPASYDLLPSQQYYNVSGNSFIQVVDRLDLFNTAIKNLNYQESKNFLINDHDLNSLALTGAESLHTQSFDNFDLRTAGVDVYAINGCKAATLGKITEITRDTPLGSSTEYRNLKLALGDGTVPLESATNLPIDQQNKFYALVADHGKMLSQNGTRQQIVNLISGSSLYTGNNLITQDVSQCQLNGRAIEVYSPINIFVTDQNGNKLGLAEDKSIMNEIPNADFEIWGSSPTNGLAGDKHKFIYLPTDNGQTYSININGTGDGIFTIKSQEISGSQTIKTEVFSNLPVTAQLAGQINLITEAATTLSLDTDGNGTIDEVLQPSSVIGPDESEDLLPPISTATLTGTEGESNFYRSEVNIGINAEDDNSGVLNINYNLDDTGFQKIAGGTAELTVSEEGEHTIIFFSTDNAGNNETEKTITFTIDKTPPEAVIEFDPNIEDLKFTGKDATSVTVADNDNVITLTDQAGNTTEITLKAKNRKRIMRAEIKDLKYNGTSVNISKNLMAFLWVYDKKNNLKTLSQHVQTKKGYNILAVYNGKKTTFLGKDAKGLIVKSFDGLKIIKVAADKGDLGWSY